MTRRAVILAHKLALEGGDRLGQRTVELVSRSLVGLREVGVTDVCVVDGEHARELHDRLNLDGFTGLRVEVRANPSWRQATGSVLWYLRDFVCRDEEPCLVLSGERPLSAAVLRRLASIRLGGYRAALVVATALENPWPDAAKARLSAPRNGLAGIVDLRLDMDAFDAWFTGHALIAPSVVQELQGPSNLRLEEGLETAIQQGEVVALDPPEEWPWQHARRGEGHVEEQVAAILHTKQHPQYTLLNPGPVNTTARVKSAMIHHDVCHRDSSFSELMVSLTDKLRRVFRATAHHTVATITGSGTAAMESALTSSTPRHGKVLVIDNGAFGERLLEIANCHGMDVVHLRYPWGHEVKVEDVERAFAEHTIDCVAMTHHETSVGLLNPIGAVGALCRRNDALLLVDAVSSLGAEDIDVVRDHVDICWSSANKCLHSISGVSFVCVAPRAWSKIEKVVPRSYYLDLNRYRRYLEECAQTPFTPAVSAYFALDAACSEFLADGHEARFEIYRRRNRRMRQGLTQLGFTPFTATGRESNSVVTCRVAEGVSFSDLYRQLRLHGYIVYGCKGVLADQYFQVANMGDLPMERIEQFLAICAELLVELKGGEAVGALAFATG